MLGFAITIWQQLYAVKPSGGGGGSTPTYYIYGF